MFTLVALILIVGAGWYADNRHEKDRKNIAISDDDEVRSVILHARQDIKLLVFLLGAVVLMLGIIADRLTR
jgi:hypothetical protein